MSEPEPSSENAVPAFRGTEYVGAVFAVLIALLLAGWYLWQWLSREPRPDGERQEPAIRFRQPADDRSPFPERPITR